MRSEESDLATDCALARTPLLLIEPECMEGLDSGAEKSPWRCSAVRVRRGSTLCWLRGIVMTVLPGLACGEGGEPMDTAHSTSSGPGTTGGSGPVTGSVSGSGDASTTALDEADTADTTAGPAGSSNARLLVAGTHEGSSGLFYLESSIGTLSDLVLVFGPADGKPPIEVVAPSPSRDYAGLLPDPQTGWHVTDLREGLPGTPVATMMPSESHASTYFEFSAGETAVVYETDSMTSQAAVWIAPLEDGVPGAPQLVAEPPTPNDVVVALPEIAENGAWMLVESGPGAGEGPNNIFLASLSDPDPGGLLPVSDLDGPGGFAEKATILPGDAGVIYRAERDTPGKDLWIVALDGGVPGAPLRVNAPFVAPQDTWGVQGIHVSPTGSGVVFWVADLAGDESGHLQWAALDGAAAAPPLALGPQSLDIAQASRVAISSDGRWIVFEAADPDLDAQALWLVDVASGAPTEPVRVAGPVEDAVVTFPRFDSTATWLYFDVAPELTAEAELFRIAVGGASPGAPQTVSGDLVEHDGVGRAFAFSEDDAQVAFATRDASNLVYVVDVGGAEPSSPVAIELPLSADRRIEGAWFSEDGSALLVGAPTENGVNSQLWLLDLTAAAPPAMIFDAMTGVVPLPS